RGSLDPAELGRSEASVDAAAAAARRPARVGWARLLAREPGHQDAREHAAAHEAGAIPIELAGRQVVDVVERNAKRRGLVRGALDVAAVAIAGERIAGERRVVEVVDQAVARLDPHALPLRHRSEVGARDLAQG